MKNITKQNRKKGIGQYILVSRLSISSHKTQKKKKKKKKKKKNKKKKKEKKRKKKEKKKKRQGKIASGENSEPLRHPRGGRGEGGLYKAWDQLLEKEAGYGEHTDDLNSVNTLA